MYLKPEIFAIPLRRKSRLPALGLQNSAWSGCSLSLQFSLPCAVHGWSSWSSIHQAYSLQGSLTLLFSLLFVLIWFVSSFYSCFYSITPQIQLSRPHNLRLPPIPVPPLVYCSFLFLIYISSDEIIVFIYFFILFSHKLSLMNLRSLSNLHLAVGVQNHNKS